METIIILRFDMSKRFISVVLITLLSVSLFATSHSFAGFFSNYTKVKASNGEIVIPINSVNDGKAHHYVYKAKNQEIKFFIVKKR